MALITAMKLYVVVLILCFCDAIGTTKVSCI